MRVAARGLPRFAVQPAAEVTLLVAPGDEPVHDGIIRFQPDRFFQQDKRLVGVFGHRGRYERQCPEKQVVGIEVVGPLAPCTLDFSFAQGWLDGADDAHCQFVLECEDVAQRTIVTVGPDIRRSCGVDVLPRDTHMVAGPAYAALQYVSNPQLPADGFRVDRLGLVIECRIAGDDEQPFDPGQSRDNLLDDPVCEILLRSVRAQVVERQHGNRRPVSRSWRRLRSLSVSDVPDEADTFPGDGADQALLGAVIADRPSRGVDPAGQGRVRHDPTAPDGGDRVVLGDDPVPVVDQVYQ